jgi:PAS domain S-box-containing protein
MPLSTVIDTWQAEPLSDQAKVLESVIECLPDGVIVADLSGTFLIFNNAAKQILGIGPRAVPSTDWAQTYGYFLPDGVTPYPNDQLPLARALRGEEVSDAEIFVRNERVPEGRWINANALPWRDETGATRGGLVIFRDVSDGKKSQERNERLSNVVEQTADSVFMTDRTGAIVYVNPAFEQVTGYSRDEALGCTPRLLKSGEHDRHFYKELWDTVLGGRVYRGTLLNRKKNGQIFHSEQTISPIAGADGQSEYLVSVAKDITERLRSERQEAELEAAHAIQQRLYPRESPQIPGFDIAGAVRPAESLCGDYFDFFPMPSGCLGITIADVMGHGVGPSILMAQARAYLRSLALTSADVGDSQPAQRDPHRRGVAAGVRDPDSPAPGPGRADPGLHERRAPVRLPARPLPWASSQIGSILRAGRFAWSPATSWSCLPTGSPSLATSPGASSAPEGSSSSFEAAAEIPPVRSWRPSMKRPAAFNPVARSSTT